MIRGVVLAGGSGSRLYPLTKVTNKHLLPVGRYPMIFHPIAKLAEAGITEILIVTGTEHMGDVVGVLGSGRHLGLEFTYRVQDRAGGIAEALGLAEGFVDGHDCVVFLGDNLTGASLTSHVEAFRNQESGARILLKEVPDPNRFGVAEIRDGAVVSIEEKPSQPKSSYAVTGVYMYDSAVFSIISDLQPSGRGELEITDVNNVYIDRGLLSYSVLDGWWTDAGVHDSFARANELARDVVLDIFEQAATHASGAPGVS